MRNTAIYSHLPFKKMNASVLRRLCFDFVFGGQVPVAIIA